MLAIGAMAGATLMPMVMKAQTTAAKTEAIWVREDCVMLIFLSVCRTIPVISELLHGLCQFYKIK
jgi:hypothetical protein